MVIVGFETVTTINKVNSNGHRKLYKTDVSLRQNLTIRVVKYKFRDGNFLTVTD